MYRSSSFRQMMSWRQWHNAAIDFIVANHDEVQSSGTLEKTRDIISEIVLSTTTTIKKVQKRQHDSDDDLDSDQHSMNELRAELAWIGVDVNGSRATLIARLKDARSTSKQWS